MTMRDLTVLTARRMIAIDEALKNEHLKPVEWYNERIRLFHAVLSYYDQADGPAERVWAAACKTLLRYQLYKEDIPKKAIDRAVMNLNKDNPSFDVWLILTCEEPGKEGK